MTFWNDLYHESQAVVIDEHALVAQQLNADLSVFAAICAKRSKWLSSPAKGVLRLLLERNGGEKTTRATSLVAYQPNSHFAPHLHPLGEEFFVLSGVFSDEHGDYPAGTYVRNPPGSSHQPFSREGCLIFVKLQQFALDDSEHKVIRPEDREVGQASILFDGYERVSLLTAENTMRFSDWCREQKVVEVAEKGIELLVLSGGVLLGGDRYEAGSWLRFAVLPDEPLVIQEGAEVWIKMGHLSGGQL